MTNIMVPSGLIEDAVRDFAVKRILAQTGRRFLILSKSKDVLNAAAMEGIAEHVLFLLDVGVSDWVTELQMQRGAKYDVGHFERENHAQAWAESQADQDFMQKVLHGQEHYGNDEADTDADRRWEQSKVDGTDGWQDEARL